MAFIIKNSPLLLLSLLASSTRSGVFSFVMPLSNWGFAKSDCQHASLVSPVSLLPSSGKNENTGASYIDAKYVAHYATEPSRKRKKKSTSKQPKIEADSEYLDADFFVTDDSTAEGDETAISTPRNESDAEDETVAEESSSSSSSSSSEKVEEQPVKADSAPALESPVKAEAEEEVSPQKEEEATLAEAAPVQINADDFVGATVVQAKASSMYRKPVTGRLTKSKAPSTTAATAAAPVQVFADDFIGANAIQAKASSMYRIAVGKTKKVAPSSAAARGPVQADDFFGSNVATSTRAHASKVKSDSKVKKKTARKKDASSTATTTPSPVSADDFFGQNVVAATPPTKSTFAGATTKKAKKQAAEKLATSTKGASWQIQADDFCGATNVLSKASEIYRSYAVKKGGDFPTGTGKLSPSATSVRPNDSHVSASTPKSSPASSKPATVKKKKTTSSTSTSASTPYQIPADDFIGATVVQSRASNIYPRTLKGAVASHKGKKKTASSTSSADAQHQAPVDDFLGRNVSSSQRSTKSGKTDASAKKAVTKEQVKMSASSHLNDFLGSTSFSFPKQRVYLQ